MKVSHRNIIDFFFPPPDIPEETEETKTYGTGINKIIK
jgi:hypothetical protein